jgi:hypothetical protein
LVFDFVLAVLYITPAIRNGLRITRFFPDVLSDVANGLYLGLVVYCVLPALVYHLISLLPTIIKP